jgi:hypothetical protein
MCEVALPDTTGLSREEEQAKSLFVKIKIIIRGQKRCGVLLSTTRIFLPALNSTNSKTEKAHEVDSRSR